MEPDIRFASAPDGVSIAWTSVGAGPALVHMPGVPLSNIEAEWRIPVLRRVYGELARSVKLVQYDGRGSGRSQRDVADLSMVAMLDDLDAVVAAAGLDRFTLLGFYHSVPLSIAYAARHPRRVAGLILFGGSVRGWSSMSATQTQALLSLIDRDWDTFVESATHAWLGWPDVETGRLAADWFRTSTTPAVAREVLQLFSGLDVSEDARRVEVPVLVLHRRDAAVIPLATSEELVAALPDAELRILEGTSAGLFFERGDAIVREIVDFVFRPSERRAGAPRTVREAASDGTRPNGLTPREVEVLRLLAGGGSNAEIAEQLGLSVNTVERHVANVYRKIDARGRADATAFAIRRGLA